MFVELHAIQNHGPSNLNRDDTGAPKTTMFGGVVRARTSSQSNKRPMREMIRDLELLQEHALGRRTRHVHRLVAARLANKYRRDAQEAQRVASAGLALIKGVSLDKEGVSKVMMFVGDSEVDTLADACQEHWDGLIKGEPGKGAHKEFEEALHGHGTVDLALFGRFIADNIERTIDAATYVAHTISTHSSSPEFDFFVAVDDVGRHESTGTGMMGTQEFISACHYRYAAVDIGQFQENLGPEHRDLAPEGLRAFVTAFIRALPKGKQNTMASHSVPSLVLGIVRADQPISLADAFADPIRPGPKGIVAQSATALDRFFGRVCKVYGDDGIRHIAVLDLEELDLPSLGAHRAETIIDFLNRIVTAAFVEATEGR